MKISYSGKKNRFFITMLVLSVLLCVLTTTAYNTGVSSFAASAFGIILSPVRTLAANTHGFIESKAVYFKNVDDIIAENKALKAQVSSLRRRLSEIEPAREENEMLYRFLEIKKERSDIKYASAKIISRSVSNYTSDFTIDKGSVHGISKDMAVVTGDNSLLGIIVEVGATYSRAKYLTSYDLSIGVKNERSGIPGILSGNYELSLKRLCEICDLSENADYIPGDIIRTSGLGDLYPAGIYIGTVKELSADKLAHTMSAVVSPDANSFESDLVMVITDFDRSFEADLPDTEEE
jgi:rod shape-determining protein MreC